VKMAILPIYRFNVIVIKLPIKFFIKMRTEFSTSYRKAKKMRIAKTILKKKILEESLTMSKGVIQRIRDKSNMVLGQRQKDLLMK